jgi:hypothetical protein
VAGDSERVRRDVERVHLQFVAHLLADLLGAEFRGFGATFFAAREPQVPHQQGQTPRGPPGLHAHLRHEHWQQRRHLQSMCTILFS